jgi:hypothetical protein
MNATTARRSLTPAQLRLCANYRNLALWTFQGWLTMFFVAAGYAKMTEPMTNLVTLMHWPAASGETLVRMLGGVEVGLAVGLLAPLISWRLGRPVLLIAAAGLLGLTVVMLGLHALRLEWGLAAVNLILAGLTATVLWGRRA